MTTLCRPYLRFGIENEWLIGERTPVEDPKIPAGVDPGRCQVDGLHLARFFALEFPEHGAVGVGFVGLPAVHEEDDRASGIVVGVHFIWNRQLVGVILSVPVDAVVRACIWLRASRRGTTCQYDCRQKNADKITCATNTPAK